MPKKLHPYFAVELLTHNIKVVLNNLAPMKRRVLRLKTSAHWLSKDLRTRIEARNLMMRNVSDEESWREFKRVRNQLKLDMMKAKRKWIIW